MNLRLDKFFPFDQSRYKQVERRKIVFVEGTDDAYVFSAIMHHLNFSPDDWQIIAYGGKDSFASQFANLCRQSKMVNEEVVTLCIVMDADDDFDRTLSYIQEELRSEGFQPPNDAGQVVKSGDVALGIYIFPDNGSSGNLEKLCLDSIKSTETYKCVEKYETCLEENESGLPNKRDKRRAQIYLAAKEPLRAGVGRAVHDGIFDIDKEEFRPLKEFLQQANEA